MTIRKIRYWLYRLKTEAQGGAKVKGAPRGFVKYWKSQNVDFKTFGEVWDVDPNNHERFIFRKKSVDQEWNEELAKEVKDLPVNEEE